MAKADETSFELDVEETSKPEKKPLSKSSHPLRKHPPKKKVHHVTKVSKEEQKKEDPPKEPEAPVLPPAAPQQPPPSLEAHPVQHANNKLSDTHHEAVVVQPPKENDNLLGIKVDPVVAAVVGTAAAVAGTTAVATGMATPAITAVKAGILKAKAALGLTSKTAAIVGGTAVAGAAMLALEKKFTDYEKDIQLAKEDVGDIGEQLKKLDKLLDSVKK